MPRVLYLTHSAGFVHPVLPESERVFQELGKKTSGLELTVSKDVALLNAQTLQRFDVLCFYTTGELPIDADQKSAFLAFLKGGKGFVGIHSATDTFYKWPDYGEIVGGYFDGHPWHEPVTIRVEDPGHPATKHLGTTFEINDEIYQFKNWDRGKVHVLLSLDPASVDLGAKGVHRTDKDFALAWTNTYGKGRMFYTALGHRDEVWNDPRFQQHLLGGVSWAAGTS
jgi:uncharacterized protein